MNLQRSRFAESAFAPAVVAIDFDSGSEDLPYDSGEISNENERHGE